MAGRIVIQLLLLAGLLGALHCVVVGGEVVTTAGVVGGAGDSTRSETAAVWDEEWESEVGVEGSGQLVIDEAEVVDDDVDASGGVDVAQVDSEDDNQVEGGRRPARALARILADRSSRRCWSTKHCRKYFKTAGCCKKKCVNVASDNKNCGKCGKRCNTKKGFSCRSGKCLKAKVKTTRKPVHPKQQHQQQPQNSQCGYNKKCGTGHTCCKGKCVKLATDNKNCGKCGQQCHTKKGYICRSGKCLKAKIKPVHIPKQQEQQGQPHKLQCGYNKECTGSGHTCCNGKCVNVGASDNGNCGKCGGRCNTENGFSCQSGKCLKAKKPTGKPVHPKQHQEQEQHHNSQCGYNKKCKKGRTCCKGKCVDLKGHNSHCGKCRKACGYGSACCNGKCVNVKHDDRNCGKCGQRCGYGHKCCNGCCKNVFGSDKHNCGACGKKCATKCQFGMCGYGH